MIILAEGEDDVYEEVVGWMQKHGCDMGEEKEVWKWLAARVEWGGIEGTRMTQLFYRLASRHRVGRENALRPAP